MVGNVGSPYKFLMYPRFIQAVLNEFPLQPHKRIYQTPCLKQKVFQNMTKATESYDGVVKPLFPQMLAKIGIIQGEGEAIPASHHHTPLSLFQLLTIHPQLLTLMRGGLNSQLLPLQHCKYLHLLVKVQVVVVLVTFLVLLGLPLSQ